MNQNINRSSIEAHDNLISHVERYHLITKGKQREFEVLVADLVLLTLIEQPEHLCKKQMEIDQLKEDILCLRKVYAKAVVAAAPPATRLWWSSDQDPSSSCFYNHTTAKSNFGEFRITWQSWKIYNIVYKVYVANKHIGTTCTLQEAKQFAEDYFKGIK